MREVLAIVYRDYLIRRTSLMWLFFDMMVPLLYLLMFGVGFNKALGDGIQLADAKLTYNEFFLAGVLSMSCFGSALNQSYGFFVDRDNGIFFEFLTYPMTRGQFLLGKILFQCLMSIAQCALTLTVGAFILGIPVQWQFTIFVFLGVIIGIAGWFFFLAIFAFLIRRNDTFNTAINMAYFILMFLSSIFYPLEHAPEWFKIVSYANPLTWHTDALRFFTSGVGNLSTILVELLCFGAFLLVSFWFAIRALQKSV